MRIHIHAIPLFALMVLPFVFATMSGPRVVCFGDIQHSDDPAAVDGCDHQHNEPGSNLVSEQHHDCTCADFDLSIVSIVWAPARLSVPPPDTGPITILDWQAPQAVCLALVRQALRWSVPFDPGGPQKLLALSTTRLLV